MMSSTDHLFLDVWFSEDDNAEFTLKQEEPEPAPAPAEVPVSERISSTKNSIPKNKTQPSQSTTKTPPQQTMTKIQQKNIHDRQEGKPRRPLTAYNLFFKNEREAIMAEQQQQDASKPSKARKLTKGDMRNPKRIGKHANVGFGNLARIVSERWKCIDVEYKLQLEKAVAADKEQYKLEMKEWELKMMDKKKCLVAIDEQPHYQVHIHDQDGRAQYAGCYEDYNARVDSIVLDDRKTNGSSNIVTPQIDHPRSIDHFQAFFPDLPLDTKNENNTTTNNNNDNNNLVDSVFVPCMPCKPAAITTQLDNNIPSSPPPTSKLQMKQFPHHQMFGRRNSAPSFFGGSASSMSAEMVSRHHDTTLFSFAPTQRRVIDNHNLDIYGMSNHHHYSMMDSVPDDNYPLIDDHYHHDSYDSRSASGYYEQHDPHMHHHGQHHHPQQHHVGQHRIQAHRRNSIATTTATRARMTMNPVTEFMGDVESNQVHCVNNGTHSMLEGYDEYGLHHAEMEDVLRGLQYNRNY